MKKITKPVRSSTSRRRGPVRSVAVGEWFCQTCGRAGTAALHNSIPERPICACRTPKWLVRGEGKTVTLPDANWRWRYPENVGTLPRVRR
jgi:hypothetical protein